MEQRNKGPRGWRWRDSFGHCEGGHTCALAGQRLGLIVRGLWNIFRRNRERHTQHQREEQHEHGTRFGHRRA